ncbi:meiosis-specific protein MEI4-like isoform X1 [Parasteatoda tepidariorum]|uniref:meiosis-specific protein MEI4-like isoform X1 n=1 Tax=Parasteatoda tepidariorum TaxID=114398 RepID=UPI0039BC3F86
MNHKPENKTDDCKNEVETGLMYYVQRIKLAVAIAIIQSTPSDKDPQQYALHLQQQFCNDITEWKDKYRLLEDKVLELNEKLTTAKLQFKTNEACLGFDDCSNIFDVPDTADPDIVSYSMESKIRNNMQFVSNFIMLNSSAACQSLCNEDVEVSSDVILKSVTNLLEMLKNEESFKLDGNFAKRAITNIHRLLTIHQEGFSDAITKMCLSFVDDLLLDIYQTTEINKANEQHHRSTLIQIVAKHRSLTISVLCRLLREITVYSDILENIIGKENDNFLPSLNAENSYFVLQSAEGVMGILKKQNSSINVLKIPDALLTEWQITTEKSLDGLGMHFPTFSIYTWHIKSLLESIICCGFEIN